MTPPTNKRNDKQGQNKEKDKTQGRTTQNKAGQHRYKKWRNPKPHLEHQTSSVRTIPNTHTQMHKRT